MKLFKGKIKGFQGSWGSGIATLLIEDSAGIVQSIPCDNAQTVRSLEAAFGNVITANHTCNGKGYIDKEIFYSVESWGCMSGFMPVSEASPKLIREYKRQQKLGKG